MICLAANGSPLLRQLLDVESLPLDAIKCPLSASSREEVTTFRAYRPVLLHGWGPDYWIGQRGVPAPDLLRELMALSSSPYLSTHLDAQSEDFEGPLTPARALERIQENTSALRKITGSDVLLENIPYTTQSRSPRFTTDPAFITESLAAAGAGFLLDLAHAHVSASQRGEEFSSYLEALPLAEAVEVHLSRPRCEDGQMRDRHLALEDDDYALLQSLLPRLPRLQTVALEYGGLPNVNWGGITVQRNDPEALRAQIFRLHALLKDHHAAGI